MSDLTKEAAYIKGLFDGMKLDAEKDETKILSAIIGFLEKAAGEIDVIDQEQGFLADQIDDIEEVVEVIAEEISDDDFDDFDDCDTYQIKCDNCGCDVPFTDDELDEITGDGIECPCCGELIKLDLGELDGECDCGCGCDHDHE
ncbi:MAG: hypothetical protein MRZ66_01960 [Clostridiales bacterium]|nr:hypothetical protein [Clostridiales bacterium]